VVQRYPIAETAARLRKTGRRDCHVPIMGLVDLEPRGGRLRLSLTDEGDNGCTTGMASESEPRVPWDEAAALEELERLRRGIEECRRRRNTVQAEFDRFVRGFRTSALEAAIAESTAIAQGSESTTVQSPAASAVEASIIVATPAAPITSGMTTEVDPAEQVMPPATSVLEPASSPSWPLPATVKAPLRIRWTGRPRLILFAAVLVVLAAIGAWLTRAWQGPPAGSRGPIPSTATVRQSPQPAASPDVQRTAPAPAGPPRSEILAVRRVWVRVVINGVKAIERELQAGERVPLPSGSTAAIRAGNAGAVQVTINGEERGLLGAEGEVVTRTLQVPAAPAR